MDKGIFIAGTDTGVGKTLVTKFLSRFLKEQGYKVIAQKWVATGIRGARSVTRARPYAFKFAGSPHLASRIEGRRTSGKRIVNCFRELAAEFDLVVVEGTGGCLVPLDTKHLLIDITKQLNLPVLVVVQNKLGAINQVLLTIEALKRRRMRIIGAVFNNLKGQNKIILKDNPGIICRLSQIDNLGVLPWSEDAGKLYEKFMPIGQGVLKWITG